MPLDIATLLASASIGSGVAQHKRECALMRFQAASGQTQDELMLVSVRPHPDWDWDPTPAAPVRVHSLAARADLNSQTGTLLSFDEPSGRGCLRLNGAGGESVRIKKTNSTYHQELKFKLPDDGSTSVWSMSPGGPSRDCDPRSILSLFWSVYG